MSTKTLSNSGDMPRYGLHIDAIFTQMTKAVTYPSGRKLLSKPQQSLGSAVGGVGFSLALPFAFYTISHDESAEEEI